MNQKGFANIVLIVLVIVVAGVVGYFALHKSPTAVTPSTYTQQTTTTNPTPPASSSIIKNVSPQPQSLTETTTWKTYRSDKYRFEFKYPPLWKEESGHNNPTNDPVVVNFQDIEFQGDVAIVHASVSVQTEERSLDFINLWRQASDASPQNAVIVAGQKALKIGGGGKIVYSILFGSKEYGIAMESANGEDVAYYQSVFKKIISTFKFIQPQQ